MSELVGGFCQSTEAPWFCGKTVKNRMLYNCTLMKISRKLFTKFQNKNFNWSDFKYSRSWSSHSDVSVGSPIHPCPPFRGAGLEQERLLDLRVPEHDDQADQQAQLPWITPS